jgi:hypothetical protein
MLASSGISSHKSFAIAPLGNASQNNPQAHHANQNQQHHQQQQFHPHHQHQPHQQQPHQQQPYQPQQHHQPSYFNPNVTPTPAYSGQQTNHQAPHAPVQGTYVPQFNQSSNQQGWAPRYHQNAPAPAPTPTAPAQNVHYTHSPNVNTHSRRGRTSAPDPAPARTMHPRRQAPSTSTTGGHRRTVPPRHNSPAPSPARGSGTVPIPRRRSPAPPARGSGMYPPTPPQVVHQYPRGQSPAARKHPPEFPQLSPIHMRPPSQEDVTPVVDNVRPPRSGHVHGYGGDPAGDYEEEEEEEFLPQGADNGGHSVHTVNSDDHSFHGSNLYYEQDNFANEQDNFSNEQANLETEDTAARHADMDAFEAAFAAGQEQLPLAPAAYGAPIGSSMHAADNRDGGSVAAIDQAGSYKTAEDGYDNEDQVGVDALLNLSNRNNVTGGSTQASHF